MYAKCDLLQNNDDKMHFHTGPFRREAEGNEDTASLTSCKKLFICLFVPQIDSMLTYVFTINRFFKAVSSSVDDRPQTKKLLSMWQ